MEEEPYENILIFHAVYKPPYGVKPFIFDEVDGYVRNNDRTKYLELFLSNQKFERMFDRIRYLIMLISDISYVYPHKYMKIKIESDDDTPLVKMINMHYVVTLINSAFDKNYDYYYYQDFLGKRSYKFFK